MTHVPTTTALQRGLIPARLWAGAGTVVVFAALFWMNLHGLESVPEFLRPRFLQQYGVSLGATALATALVAHMKLKYAPVYQAATALIFGIVGYLGLATYQIATHGAMPMRIHDLVISVFCGLIIAGAVDLWGTWRKRLVGQVRRDASGAPEAAAMRKLVLLSRVGTTFWAAQFVVVLIIHLVDIDWMAPYLHQYAVSAGTMPLIVGVISYEQTRDTTTTTRASRYLWGGVFVMTGLFLIQVCTGGAIHLYWQELLMSSANAVALAGAVLRYRIWQTEVETRLEVKLEHHLNRMGDRTS